MSDRLTLEIAKETTFGPCSCCGQMTKRVWGYVYRLDAALAVYYVQWTPGHEAKSADFDLIVSPWGENTHASQRSAVSLKYRVLDTGPSFMVVDASTRAAENKLASHSLTRAEIIGTPLAAEVFAICDAIYTDDPRIMEILP
jgi:hypothetical protein